MMRELARRIRNSFAYGVTTTPVSLGPDGLPQVQVRLTAIETPTLRVVEQHGFASDLPVGTPVTAQFAAGDRSNGVITGSSAPGERPLIAGTGDRSFYGHGFEVRISADGVHITGAPKVTITGDLEVMGEVTAKFGTGAFVTLSQHKGHTGGSDAPTPNT